MTDLDIVAESLGRSFKDVLDFGLKASNDDIAEIKAHVINNIISAVEAEEPPEGWSEAKFRALVEEAE